MKKEKQHVNNGSNTVLTDFKSNFWINPIFNKQNKKNAYNTNKNKSYKLAVTMHSNLIYLHGDKYRKYVKYTYANGKPLGLEPLKWLPTM